MHQLFSLLDIGVVRRVLTGVSRDWPDADPVDVAASTSAGSVINDNFPQACTTA